MPDRRTFLAGMLAAGLAPKPSWADAGSPAYLSAAMAPDGSFVLCGLSAKGDIAFKLPLPARGHAAAAHPKRPEAVAFARRPGTFAIVLDCRSGAEIARLAAPEGRHFYGHGAFSPDGDLLFTTENAFEDARGMIGVWDASNGYQRLGDFPSGGVGPHDIRLMPDGTALVVANGGIETHPETGRAKLNLPTMRSNLSYVSLDGRIVEQADLDDTLQKNSIRHLAVSPGGIVAFAMQWQGDLAAHPPLLGLHAPGAPARLIETERHDTAQMAGYVGSVAISQDRLAATSPRGGTLQMFDVPARGLTGQLKIEDVCGVAPASSGFIATSGLGLVAPNVGSPRGARTHVVKWDNHLVVVGCGGAA
ncbi:MAG: DUF1513 domain-containing protein [Pseudomonadota bacterium]